MPVYDASIKHISLTPSGATHWVSGPGNLSFDPDCPRCWMDAWEVDRERLETLERVMDISGIMSWTRTIIRDWRRADGEWKQRMYASMKVAEKIMAALVDQDQLPQNEDRLTPETLRKTVRFQFDEMVVRRHVNRHSDAWEAEQKRAEADRKRLEALELEICTCPWPEDAMRTRHNLACRLMEMEHTAAQKQKDRPDER